jgi:hypothetical protein
MTMTNLDRKRVVCSGRSNGSIIRRFRRAGRLMIRDHRSRWALWRGERNLRRLKRRDRDLRLLGIKYPTMMSMSTLPSNIKRFA